MDTDQQPIQQPGPQVQTTPIEPTIPQSRCSYLIPVVATALITSALFIGGYFTYQYFQITKPQSSKTGPTNLIEVSAFPTQISPIITETAMKWTTLQNKAFSIQYPENWRQIAADVGGGGMVGFGPPEVGEDVAWVVNWMTKTAPSYATFKKTQDELGKQFTDRIQKVTTLTINGHPATKIVTTTPSVADWYYEAILVETPSVIFTISNGAITDANLSKIKGVQPGITFEQFYTSFKLVQAPTGTSQ